MQWQPRKGKDDPRGRYKQTDKRRLSIPRVILGLGLAAILIFGAVKLVGYVSDWFAARNSVQDLRDLYYSVSTESPAPAATRPTAAPTGTPAPSHEPTETPAPIAPTQTPEPTALILPTRVPTDVPATAAPRQTPIPKLDAVPYPDNAELTVSSRFKALQRESKYIVGWLNVDRLVDEPVMQRDNVYYLNHDVNGKTNVNGALFLDASADLKTRPYSLVIYGHNMKSGAMFGSLRNYENSTYYHRSPFITFDTMYEDGRYVIFAVCTVNVEEDGPNYVDFFDLYSTAVAGRQKTISTLISSSVHTCTVDVTAEDQLLLLVTCVDNDNERRVIAARRVRDTETESELRKLVQKTKKK